MKIIGTNIYLTTDINEEDVEILATCWDPYRYAAHTERSKELFLGIVQKDNEAFDFSALDKGVAYFIIKKKVDDSPIGYTHFKNKNNQVNFMFTIMLPSEQQNGYYSEMNILRHKYVYQEIFSTAETHIRKAKNTRQDGSLNALYVRNEREETIADRGEFIHSYILKDEWISWIDASEQESKKNATFIVEN